MFSEIFRFEVRYHLRQPLFWLVFFAFALMTFGAETSDAVTIGGSIGNVHRNAPFVILQILTVMTIVGMFVTTAFVATAVHRDVEHNTAELFFSTPMRKRDYLFGRFAGASLVSLLVYLGPALGILVGSFMPWLEPERLGPFQWSPYAFALLVIVLPNVLLCGALFFGLAALSRSLLVTYLGVVAFLVFYLVTGRLLEDVENELLASLLDPFGFGPIDFSTRYWTVTERNSLVPELTGLLLWNRLLWLAVALGLLALTYSLFVPGREGLRWRRKRAHAAPAENGTAAAPTSPQPQASPAAAPSLGAAASRAQLWHQIRLEVRLVLKSVPFLVMAAFGAMNVIGSASFSNSLFGASVYPVTHLMLGDIDGSYLFLLGVIVTFYAGELVWRERSLRLAEVTDAMPVASWVPLIAKLVALWSVVVVFGLIGIAATIGYQLWNGFYRLEPALYAQGLALALVFFLLLAVLAIFLQVVSGNKFVGFLGMIVFMLSGIVLNALHFEHNLYQFAGSPASPYSDMNGYGHLLTARLWFWAYWAAFALLLALASRLLWVRGTGHSWRDRLAIARARFGRSERAVAALGGVAFLALGSWIFYNTNVLNEYVPSDVAVERQARYEQTYRQYLNLPQPRITAVEANADIFPRQRRVTASAVYTLVNRTPQPLDTVHLSIPRGVEVTQSEMPSHAVELDDRTLGYRILRLAEPLAPGATMTAAFQVVVEHPGFVNNGSDNSFVDNGTFFNNQQVFPVIGYDPTRELQDRNERRKHDLPPVQRMPKIDDQAAKANTYLGLDSDWIRFAATVSTDPDQVALAPGYLEREWQDGGRRYFRYTMDAPILHFYSFLSARWEITRDKWVDEAGGREVAIEIYHLPQHRDNVARMIEAVQKSLAYFSANFSPYQHRQVRIIEFPRYATFAQSFPNTIPYSESIGFIADLRDPEEVDYVFYVTAHEVAHQWWAHQVIGANVQGATMLSETLSQYAALMVMEQEYGRSQMRKFLKYELDRYLRRRSGELVEELPLALVENQPYIHYDKGSLVFYQLRELLGEATVNRVLAEFVRTHAFQGPPFPTSRDLIAQLRAAAPADQQSAIDDLFESIVLYSNRVESATAKERADGKWEVALVVEAQKLSADGQGVETEMAMDDEVEIGVFARPEGGKESQETALLFERRRLGAGRHTLTFTVDSRPYDAGIDPYNKLVDRKSDDNRKRVEIDES